MTNLEAKGYLKNIADHTIWQFNVEALQMGIAAIEKQTPKKPVMGYMFTEKFREAIRKTDPERAESKTDCCPTCGRSLGVSQFVKAQTGLSVGGSYCKWCGQAIDWGKK